MYCQPSGKQERRLSPSIVGLIVALMVSGFVAAPARIRAQDKPAEKTLYQRLGGYDAIVGIVDAFLGQMRKDPAFERFGGGRSHDSLVRSRQLVIDQICFLAGGPCTYIGRDTKTAHTGLKITDKEWDASIEMFRVALNQQKIAGTEQQEFLAMIEKLRPDVVEKPKEEYPKAKN
ncbi:MAG: group 1 truncated hemoglobin [Terriglobia bacterium]